MKRLTEKDIAALVGTTVAGYEILQARAKGGRYSDSDCFGIALGKNAVGNYVTWQFKIVDEQYDCFWGHYYLIKSKT